MIKIICLTYGLKISPNQAGVDIQSNLKLTQKFSQKLNKSDDDPIDIILSPNRELKFLEIEGRWNSVDRKEGLHQIKVISRDSESRTIKVNRLPEEDAILTSAPRTRMIRGSTRYD